jgi:transcriptional regulator with XRE-family HTH domain
MSATSTATGRRIAQARRERRLTQAELAARIGVSPRSVHAYESGSVVPYRHLAALERELGRPTSWLLAGTSADGGVPSLDEVAGELGRLREEVTALADAVRMLATTVRIHGGR